MLLLPRVASCRKINASCRSRARCRKLAYVSTLTSLYMCYLLVGPQFPLWNSSQSQDPSSLYDDLECGCPRVYPRRLSTPSLCSASSSARGGQQRVVAYSVHGPFSSPYHHTKYWAQVEPRIRDVTEKYPDWTFRLYHNITKKDKEPHKFLCDLYCKYPNFDPCNAEELYPELTSLQNHGTNLRGPTFVSSNNSPSRNSKNDYTGHGEKVLSKLKVISHIRPHLNNNRSDRLSPPNMANFHARDRIAPVEFAKKLIEGRTKEKNQSSPSYAELLVPTMWRFLPMADFSVEVFLVRDIDSSILAREVDAVRQWLDNTTAIVHVMRDHPRHNGVILAGMWGGSQTRGSVRLKDLFLKMLRWPPRQLWDYDQRLLQRVVWPEIKDAVAIHDSYLCRNKRFTANHQSLPFPSQRVNMTFVSWGVMRDHEKKGIVPCPRACRPRYHQDWTYC